MQKILIIQTAFIGDVILATPIIEALHKNNPEAKLDFMLRKGNESLLKNHPFLNKLIIWDKKAGKYKQLLKHIKQIRAEKYDFVINIQRFGTTGILTALSNAQVKIGFKNNPFSFAFTHKINHSVNQGLHEIERNLNLLNPIFKPEKVIPTLYPSEHDFNNVETYNTQKYICIAPTSVWFTKQYPKEKWIDFLNKVPNDFTIYLLGGPSDQENCQAIQDSSTHQNIKNLAGLLNMLESAALMKNAYMNFVNDSAPMHMASAVNAPTTAIFCSTVPSFGFGPLASNSKIIEIDDDLKCRPCGLHGHRKCPEDHFNCAFNINNKKLLERLN